VSGSFELIEALSCLNSVRFMIAWTGRDIWQQPPAMKRFVCWWTPNSSEILVEPSVQRHWYPIQCKSVSTGLVDFAAFYNRSSIESRSVTLARSGNRHVPHYLSCRGSCQPTRLGIIFWTSAQDTTIWNRTIDREFGGIFLRWLLPCFMPFTPKQIGLQLKKHRQSFYDMLVWWQSPWHSPAMDVLFGRFRLELV